MLGTEVVVLRVLSFILPIALWPMKVTMSNKLEGARKEMLRWLKLLTTKRKCMYMGTQKKTAQRYAPTIDQRLTQAKARINQLP